MSIAAHAGRDLLARTGPAARPSRHAPADASDDAPHTMRCFEVWGGSHAVDNAVAMPGLDAWLYSRPFDGHAAGGDIHFLSSCAAGLVTRALIADVSGHGRDVAHVADDLRALMRRYVNYLDQSRLVRALNEQFGAIAGAGGFATAAVATYLAPEGRLTLTSAGHPAPLWYHAGRWSLLRPTRRSSADGPANIPLGVADPTRYDQINVVLGAGDVVLLYTDALIEAPGDAGRPLGEDGLLRLVADLDPTDPAELIGDLLARVRPGADDVTLLAIRRNALVPRASVPRLLLADARLIARLLAAAITGRRDAPWPDAGPLARLGALLHRVNSRWGPV